MPVRMHYADVSSDSDDTIAKKPALLYRYKVGIQDCYIDVYDNNTIIIKLNSFNWDLRNLCGANSNYPNAAKMQFYNYIEKIIGNYKDNLHKNIPIIDHVRICSNCTGEFRINNININIDTFTSDVSSKQEEVDPKCETKHIMTPGPYILRFVPPLKPNFHINRRKLPSPRPVVKLALKRCGIEVIGDYMPNTLVEATIPPKYTLEVTFDEENDAEGYIYITKDKPLFKIQSHSTYVFIGECSKLNTEHEEETAVNNIQEYLGRGRKIGSHPDEMYGNMNPMQLAQIQRYLHGMGRGMGMHNQRHGMGRGMGMHNQRPHSGYSHLAYQGYQIKHEHKLLTRTYNDVVKALDSYKELTVDEIMDTYRKFDKCRAMYTDIDFKKPQVYAYNKVKDLHMYMTETHFYCNGIAMPHKLDWDRLGLPGPYISDVPKTLILFPLHTENNPKQHNAHYNKYHGYQTGIA